jgi:uncharacterized membrane protein YedE/YeeE
MSDFTPGSALAGGLLIGLSAALLLLVNGKIAGISGILGSLLTPVAGDVAWRVAFLGGLVAAGLAMVALVPEWFAVTVPRGPTAIVTAGLLVGFGTRLGSGCTSGHGVCGVARLSRRSILATMSFIAAGTLSVLVSRWVLGGLS